MKFKYKTEPYKHQHTAYSRYYYDMLDGKRDILALFMEQGTGKTKTILDLATNLYLENKIDACMIIAPNGVQQQWADEQIPEHVPVEYVTKVWKSKKSRIWQRVLELFITTPSDKLKCFCINVEAFSSPNHLNTFKEFLVNNRTFLIIDESTRIKTPTANRTINICQGLCRIQKKGKRVMGVLNYSKYRSVLTGTMVTNSPFDLWSMFEFLQHDYFDMNYHAFKNRYGLEIRDASPAGFGSYNRKMRKDEMEAIRVRHKEGTSVETIAGLLGATESSVQYIIDNPKCNSPYKNLAELKKLIQKDSYILRKVDCLDLPPKVYSVVNVEMNSEQKRIYKELVKNLLTEYENKELSVLNKVSLIGRLQQVTGGFFPYDEGKGKTIPITCKNPKMEVLKKELDESGGEKIIIWARFVAEIQLITQELKKAYPNKRVEAYYGKVLNSVRKTTMEDFKAGKIDVLVGNKTMSTGWNLQICHFQIFYSNSYSLEDRLQQEDRSHRSGQTESVLYKDIIMKNTVDEKVFKVLSDKKELLDYFRDNSIEDFLMDES